MMGLNYDQIHNNWIKPELDKRKAGGLIEKDFRFTKCLITFPKNSNPIVKFNNEFGFAAMMKLNLKEGKNKGDPIFPEEYEDIADVELPSENGERLAFIYLQFNGSYSEGASYDYMFDFTPNNPIKDSEKEKYSKIAKEGLIKLLKKQIRETITKFITHHNDLLMKNGLWIIPALIPTPLNKIIRALKEDNITEAREIIMTHCSEEFLMGLMENWWELKEFNDRKEIIEEAFFCHRNQRYITTISTLIPHFEGIITDFGYSVTTEMRFRQESKTKDVKKVLENISLSTFEFQSVLYFTFAFLIDGPMLETFKDWFQKVNVDFPNRHAVGHGKYIKELYTKENSIKVFLLLDAIYWIIKEYISVNVIEHQEIAKTLHKVNLLDSEGKTSDALTEVEELLKHTKFTMKYDFFRQAVYYKMVFYYELERLDEALELLDEYGINELSEASLTPFNIKSLILAKKGDFENAHRIIDEVIKITQGELEILDYTDTKAEIFQIEGKFQEAINIYESILKRLEEEIDANTFVYFNHMTHIRLGICYKEKGEIEKAIKNIKIGKQIAEQRHLKKWIKKAENLLSELNEL